MLKLAADPQSSSLVLENGVKIAVLKHPRGLSTIGVHLSIGGIDSDRSGQSFITIGSKLRDAIGSPQYAFRKGISTKFDFHPEYANILFQFQPESTGSANIMLDKFFFDNKVSPIAVTESIEELSMQELMGNLRPSDILASSACAASFPGTKYSVECYTNDTKDLHPNQQILDNLQYNATFFGSADQIGQLKSLASTFKIKKEEKKIEPITFQPGVNIRKSSGLSFSGNKLIKGANIPHLAISFPAGSIFSNDFYTYKVIQKIFGGGQAFSSEGLGAGLNSLLYKNILARIPSVEEIRCKYEPYKVAGLMSIQFQAHEEKVPRITNALKYCIEQALQIGKEHLDSAREQAVLEYLKTIDQSQQRFVEFGTQYGLIGKSIAPATIVEAIRSVTISDVIKCVENSFKRKPSVSVIGDSDPELVYNAWD